MHIRTLERNWVTYALSVSEGVEYRRHHPSRAQQAVEHGDAPTVVSQNQTASSRAAFRVSARQDVAAAGPSAATCQVVVARPTVVKPEKLLPVMDAAPPLKMTMAPPF